MAASPEIVTGFGTMWRFHWQDRGAALKVPESAMRSPAARPRDGLGTVTVAVNQRGHGNKQDSFLFLFRAVCF